jgi:hypothetical protein
LGQNLKKKSRDITLKFGFLENLGNFEVMDPDFLTIFWPPVGQLSNWVPGQNPQIPSRATKQKNCPKKSTDFSSPKIKFGPFFWKEKSLASNKKNNKIIINNLQK